MRKILFLLSILCLNINAHSPWTKEKGKLYSQLSFSTIPNYNTFFGNPDYSIDGKITDNTFQFYTEYGILKNTSVLLNIPYKSIRKSNFKDPRIDCSDDCSKNFNSSSLGNVEIGIKHNFLNKKNIISFQFSVEINTSSFDENSGIRTGYDAYTFTPLFLYGKSVKKGYLQAYVGSNIRTNDYSSTFKIGGEYGQRFSKKILLAGFIDIVKSLKNGNIELPVLNQFNALYVNNQEYGVFGVKLIVELNNNFGLIATLPSAFFGNNVPKQLAITSGIYYKI